MQKKANLSIALLLIALPIKSYSADANNAARMQEMLKNSQRNQPAHQTQRPYAGTTLEPYLGADKPMMDNLPQNVNPEAIAGPDHSGGLSTLFSQRNNTSYASTNAAQTVDPVEPPPKRRPTMRDEAFRQLLDKISPLTPDQIVEMRKQQDKTQQAVATLPNTPPRPVSSTLTIDLSPGVTPPVVRLGAGFVSSLVFVDSTGQPWPIADYSLGNPKNFNIQWDRKTNTLFVQGNTTYSSGNLAVRLGTLDTPVMLTLISGQREVDYRVDLQVSGRGPNATAPIVGDNLSVQNPLLLSVLDGVAPPGSTELVVSPDLGRAWIANGKLIFRTRVTVLSPAWSATVSSADGTRVYEMMQTPLILGSENGHPVNIELRGL